MLEDISKGVDRLHGQAQQINQEAKVQIKLLDNLDYSVEVTTTELEAQTRHAERVREKSRACYMYICIAVEVLILVLLAIIFFAK